MKSPKSSPKYYLLSAILLSCFTVAYAEPADAPEQFSMEQFSMPYSEEAFPTELEVETLEEELATFEKELSEDAIETVAQPVAKTPAEAPTLQTPPEMALPTASEELLIAQPTPQSQTGDVHFKEPALAQTIEAPAEIAMEGASLEAAAHQELAPVERTSRETAAFEVTDDMQELPLLAAAEDVTASEEPTGFEINLKQVFAGAPVIYSLLFAMSIAAVFIWIYTLISLRYTGAMPEALLKQLRNKLNSNQYEEALGLCLQHQNFFCKMLASAISARKHGFHIMLESMKSEGQRATIVFWQRLALLNDIAIIAPMFGLLGTVLGMFYAFYDIHRSMKSMSTFFDGLGISVGTTVAGLLVAILSLILHSIAKYRLVRHLAYVENEAQTLAALMDNRSSIYDNK